MYFLYISFALLNNKTQNDLKHSDLARSHTLVYEGVVEGLFGFFDV